MSDSSYIPISGSIDPLIHNTDESLVVQIADTAFLTEIVEGKIQTPKDLSELTNEKTETIKLSVDSALKLQIPIGTTENKLSRIIFVQEYKKYQEIAKNTGIVHYGISIRWIINIQKLNSSANITSLPMVAASGQFNYVSASARFEVNGISSQEITKLIPAPTDLTTETYIELNNAFSQIKEQIWISGTTIKPKILGIYGNLKNNEENIFEDSIAIYHALKMISKGKNLGKALRGIDDSKKELIKTVYMEIAKTSDMSGDISKEAKDEAEKFIKLIK